MTPIFYRRDRIVMRGRRMNVLLVCSVCVANAALQVGDSISDDMREGGMSRRAEASSMSLQRLEKGGGGRGRGGGWGWGWGSSGGRIVGHKVSDRKKERSAGCWRGERMNNTSEAEMRHSCKRRQLVAVAG